MAKLYTREEIQRRRVKFQVFAGMFDFLAVVVGVIVIVGCIILIASLIRWIAADVPVTFHKMWEMLEKSIIIPE